MILLSAEGIFRQYAPRVRRLIERLLGNDADADDVTQEVFLQVLRRLSTFRGDSSLITWLTRVAIHAALAFRRQRACRRKYQSPVPLEVVAENGRYHRSGLANEPLKQMLETEQRQRIDQAIKALPPPIREVYVLAEEEELSNGEIAQRLGLSLAAVKSRLHRARLLLRRALANYVEDDSLV